MPRIQIGTTIDLLVYEAAKQKKVSWAKALDIGVHYLLHHPTAMQENAHLKAQIEKLNNIIQQLNVEKDLLERQLAAAHQQ